MSRIKARHYKPNAADPGSPRMNGFAAPTSTVSDRGRTVGVIHKLGSFDKEAFPMTLPKSKLLQSLIGWFAGGVLFHAIVSLFRRNDAVGDRVGNFFLDLLAPYLWGSFCSEIPLVWMGSAAAAAAYAASVTRFRGGSARLAKIALAAILLLSLFTLWIEPYSSLGGAASKSAVDWAANLAKVPMKLLDVGVSIFWVVVYLQAVAALRRESLLGGVAERKALPRRLRVALTAIVVSLFLLWLARQWINQ